MEECELHADSSTTRNWDELFDIYAKVITGDDDTLKIRATVKLAKLSRYAPGNVLARTLPILLELLENPSAVQAAAAYCLKHIASKCEGKLANIITQLGGIHILLKLLPDSEHELKRTTLKCLRNIVSFSVPSRSVLSSSGGLDTVVSMLGSSPGDCEVILLEILSALSLLREVRKSLCESRQAHFLVRAAGHGCLVSRARAAQAIGLMGVNKRARAELVEAGVMPVLARLLNEGDELTRLVAGNALGVILVRVGSTGRTGLIPLYIDMLRCRDPTLWKIAEDVLFVLAVDKENAVEIAEQLMRILRGNDAGAKAVAADVVWALVRQECSARVMWDSGVVGIVVELLEDEDGSVRENASGVVAQLSYSVRDRAALAGCGAIPLLVRVMSGDESGEDKEYAAEALLNFSIDPLWSDQVTCVMDNRLFLNMCESLRRVWAVEENVGVISRGIRMEESDL
ncbi:ARM repeat superfamily protein [Striga hermonthica]|uniref:ARM repeat superfamily protein n=1 Tax=Striga hermonthica TaxID=68872 RepID=A0A9N7MMU2_STRHE|nr:ARM repeat superfamily protein [Striga hermonthica]